ncbi:hypothetical protein F3Y22_tig00111273pilonHSYRG00232 [Hibiscus syriacus]|uniref:Uncharacterized protein n=1 Tax=Hibiscus syriacus TaxID=106335 RepID=A0A6A2YSC5_HIBSY|nr:hypothetical protein F3Y22_tig00111273pilonHSYRG00232 [Hibiscus syriacus]
MLTMMINRKMNLLSWLTGRQEIILEDMSKEHKTVSLLEPFHFFLLLPRRKGQLLQMPAWLIISVVITTSPGTPLKLTNLLVILILPMHSRTSPLQLTSILAPSSSSHSADPGSAPAFIGQAKPAFSLTKPADAEQQPLAPLDIPAGNYLPPSDFNQRHQFFEQQHGYTGNSSHSIDVLGSSYDSFVGRTQNLSINSKIPTQQVKPEDDFFKDLLDFASAKPSSSSKPNNMPF